MNISHNLACMKRTHLIGVVGSTLDRGLRPERWNRWRPSVALCQHEDLHIDHYHLLYFKRERALAELIAADIVSVSPGTTVELQLIHMRDAWDFRDVYETLYDVARQLPDTQGIDYLVNVTTGTHVIQICLFLLTESRQIPGRLIQAQPLPRKQQQPAGSYSIIDLDLSKYDGLAARFAEEKRDDISFLKSGIATRNEAFNRLIAQIERVAVRSSEPILLLGPTGAGKSHLARRIFELAEQKHRLTGAFVEANCATLQGTAAMSALFGHRKGAYTGATTDRPGLLRAANQGMVFLDEVGELGLDEQAMLLRAVEEGIFYPLGSDTPVKSRFQLICGTNRDLSADVSEGRFRADLLARINCWTFRLPGLHQRREDIEPNLTYELEAYAQRTGQRVRFNKEALAHFLAFAHQPGSVWAANFRDLNAAVLRMATLAPSGRIRVDEVEEEMERLQTSWRGAEAPEEDGLTEARTLLGEAAWEQIDRFDRYQLAGVLQSCRAHATLADAGRYLFAASRATRTTRNDSDRLRKYLQRFGLEWSQVNGR
jgi:transcriptional regulatory protein RtcR